MSNPRLRYQTIEFGKIDIHVCSLRNKQEFYDPDDTAQDLGISSATWSLFGVVWPSSLVLAHYMSDFKIEGKRILEVGCGMALSSLLLNKQHANITATDYHPEAGAFLKRNVTLNGDEAIQFQRVDWADSGDELGLFDVIIGSDILYEDDHIDLLSKFIEQHAQEACEVIIVDPGRGRKNKLTNKMTAFGFDSIQTKPIDTAYLDKEFKGYILNYNR